MEEEPATLDAMHYLWLRKVIPDLSLVRYLPTGETFFSETSGISFNKVHDRQKERLLDTFGVEKDGQWRIPIPRITLIGSSQTINDLLEQTSPPNDRSVALVAEDSKTVTRFFDKGEEVGTLTADRSGSDVLRTVEGRTVDMRIPAHSDNSEMAKLFANDSVKRQLGLVTLQRVLS